MTRSISAGSLAGVAVLFVTGCYSVDSARENYAQRACQYYQKCGDIGSGKAYESPQTCLNAQRDNAVDLWPTNACAGKINPEPYDLCLRTVDNTKCNDFFDQLATAAKCSSSNVCTANSGASCNCGEGQTCCGNACTDLRTDRSNCGGCGTTCGSGLSCQSGVCR